MENSWIKVAPEGAVTSKGEQWAGYVKPRDPKRVIVYFHGGGVSFDEYMAARPLPEGFYTDSTDYDPADIVGISDDSAENPFRDWTVFSVSYATGDVHTGRGDFPYTALDGSPAILHHRGYDDYTLFMNEAKKLAGDPEKVIICGYSAGGFAAALLADDVIANHFPNAENVTVLCDSGVLFYDGWRHAAEKVWNVPPEIAERMHSRDATFDSLAALAEKYGGKVKILYACSTRDCVLSVFQSFADGGEFSLNSDACDRFTDCLRLAAEGFEKRIPGAGLYFWDEPYGDRPFAPTKHTVICFKDFYRKKYADGVTAAEWLTEAVNGRVTSHGLGKLRPKG